MFSSNQKLTISGTNNAQSIKNALEFALNLADFTGPIGWQISKDNKFCIGSARNDAGWEPFNFTLTLKTVASIIEDWIASQDSFQSFDGFDGSCEKGFLMEAIETDFSSEGPIKNSFYGIVSFSPYTAFFAK